MFLQLGMIYLILLVTAPACIACWAVVMKGALLSSCTIYEASMNCFFHASQISNLRPLAVPWLFWSLSIWISVSFPLSPKHRFSCFNIRCTGPTLFWTWPMHSSFPFQFSYLPFSLPWYQRICLRLLIAYLVPYYWLSCVHMNWSNIVVHLCTIIFSIDNNFFIFYCLAKPLVFHKQQQNDPLWDLWTPHL